ncbi:VirB4-like conjugal transfer ATPase, CD1110 family, partial [Streptococcus suis]
SLSSLRYELTGDGYDDYRKEYNEMITERFSDDQNTFKIEKYVTITTQANQDYQAKRILDDMANVIESQYSSIGISFKEMDGLERL